MSNTKFSEQKFEELSIAEQRNEILKAIHNRLAEIVAVLPYLTSVIARRSFSVDAAIKCMYYDAKYIEHSSKIYDYEDEEAQEGEE